MSTMSSTLPADSSAPASARSMVREFLGTEGEMPVTLTTDAALLTSELITNSVLHSGLRRSDLITMELILTDDVLRVVVSDADVPFEIDDDPRPRDIGGWGLVMVAHVSDRWGIVPNRPNHVWFELDR